MTVTLTPEKIEKIAILCNNLWQKQRYTIRECAGVIGNLVAAEPGVDNGLLHFKPLEHAKDRALRVCKGNFESQMQVTEVMKEDLEWWVVNARTLVKHLV